MCVLPRKCVDKSVTERPKGPIFLLGLCPLPAMLRDMRGEAERMLMKMKIPALVFLCGVWACQAPNKSDNGANTQDGHGQESASCANQNCSGHGSCEEAAEIESGYRCVCTSGWEGNECETDINGCAEQFCTYHGSCVDAPAPQTGYTCECIAGWSGTDCEIGSSGGEGEGEGEGECEVDTEVENNACAAFPRASSCENFISIWRTTEPNETIELPLRECFAYDFTVDWGDGSPISSITSWDDPDRAHTYSSAADYTLVIDGHMQTFYFNQTEHKDKIISISSLGDMGWTSFERAFEGCSNLTSVVGGNTVGVTNMSSMFYLATSVTPDTSNWDTGQVTDMAFMFEDANLSNENYDSLLIGWNSLSSLQNDTAFHAGNAQYCSGASAR